MIVGAIWMVSCEDWDCPIIFSNIESATYFMEKDFEDLDEDLDKINAWRERLKEIRANPKQDFYNVGYLQLEHCPIYD